MVSAYGLMYYSVYDYMDYKAYTYVATFYVYGRYFIRASDTSLGG